MAEATHPSDVTHTGLADIYQMSGRIADKEALAKGDHLKTSREERFRTLYEQHVEALARYVARRTAGSDIQDVVSDTFLTAWRRFDELPSDPLPWLFVTARKLIANRHRSTERRGALHTKLAASPVWIFEQPVRSDLSEIDARLLTAIRALPTAEREAFMLIAWDGLDGRRASQAAGCSPATFRMRLHRARRRLRGQLENRPFGQPEPIPTLEEQL